MATQSPFSLVEGLLRTVNPGISPPAWIVAEVQRRMVLLLNHVLMQEPEAMSRLKRQKGRLARVKWGVFAIELIVTPAGLLDLAQPGATPDLSIFVTEESATGAARAWLGGNKPSTRIEGDVLLAAEVNWLVDHVRWDLEEDLARLLGDAPAHAVAQWARQGVDALRQFAGPRVPPHSDSAAA